MRAHLAFPTLSSLALSLIHNALDAGAKVITVTLDFAIWSLECVDDGRGFPLEMFDGHLRDEALKGSAASRILRYGWKGSSLRLMAHLGRLSISSIPEGTPDKSYALIQKGDVCTFSGSDPARDTRSHHRGSRVTLSDMFVGVTFSLRIRADGSDEGDWSTSALKEGLCLNKATSLRARLLDAYAQHTLRCEHLVEIRDTSTDSSPIAIRGLISLAPVYTKEIQHIFLNKQPLAPGSSFTEHAAAKSGMHESERAHRSQQASGSAMAHMQFGDADSDLFAAVCSVFQSSVHFRHSVDRSLSLDSKRALEGSARRSPTKTKGTHPAFLLDVTVNQKADMGALTMQNGSKRNRLSIKKVLQEVIADSLRKNGLLYEDSAQEISPSKLRRTTSYSASIDAVQSHIPSEIPEYSPRKRRRLSLEPPITSIDRNDEQSQHSFIEYTHEVTGRKYLIDPRTGNSYEAGLVPATQVDDQRSCLPVDLRSTLQRFGSGRTFGKGVGSAATRSDLFSIDDTQPDYTTATAVEKSQSGSTPTWLRSAVAGWKNPVLPLPDEVEIPSLAFSATSTDLTALTASSLASIRRRETNMLLPAIQAHSRFFQDAKEASRTVPGGCSHSVDDDDNTRLNEIEATLDKETLRSARVLGQVDRKFVLCVVALPRADMQRLPSSQALLLIDQHAADERIRVERLLQEYVEGCRAGSPHCHKLREPAEAGLASGEIEALQGNDVVRRCLRRGGFDLQFQRSKAEPDSQSNSSVRLYVNSIPSVIKERVLAERELLTALIRDFIASAGGERGSSLLSHFGEQDVKSSGEGSRFGWIGILRTLPRLMLDLIYSRACRGAIMFNDILTQEQCERLVADVAETAFPFQCAHGRPSMLPLVQLPSRSQTSSAGGLHWRALL
ncbi:hypothetical protein A4X09_0g319 [Tilletia walkeri]|uniref:MutL C-terminal dimerisation domain-containing protein n=1 Tax=Tilletia walkeri TaxID=117179 RepID=A0A8X7NFL9_9BASI|nr:hypothetical protein A4X09_0g319 [Tilletia walkeri]